MHRTELTKTSIGRSDKIKKTPMDLEFSNKDKVISAEIKKSSTVRSGAQLELYMIKTRELQDLIGTDKERLRIWIDRGIFGTDKVGVGPGRAGRKFNMADALLARCLRELLDLTWTRGLLMEGELLEDLRQAVHFVLQRPNESAWFVLTWGGEEGEDRVKRRGTFHVSLTKGGPEPAYALIRRHVGHPCAFIVLPVHDFYVEIRRYFERTVP